MTKFLGIIAAGLLSVSASAQILIGVQTQSPTTATITVNVGGLGTGTVGYSNQAGTCPGTCTDTVPLNTTVTLTATPTGGGTFGGWAGACSGTLTTCPILVLANASVAANFQPSGGGGTIGSYPMFVIDPNQANHWPGLRPSTTGGGRIWDTPQAQWVWQQTGGCVAPFPCTTAYNFANRSGVSGIDSILGLMNTTVGVAVPFSMMPIGREPGLASSWQNGANTSTSGCTEDNTPVGQFGQCYPPLGLNADGSGNNQVWHDWVTAISTHVHAPGYSTNHAVINSWEVWNEPDTGCTKFFCGTYDQAIRMEEDLYFLVKGDVNFTFTSITTNTTAATYVGTFTLGNGGTCANNYCAGMRVNVTGMLTANNKTAAIVCNSTSTTLKLGTAASIQGAALGALITNSCTPVSTTNSDSGGTIRFVESFPDGSGTYRTAAQVQAAPHSSQLTFGLANSGALNAPVSTTDTVFMGSFHGGTSAGGSSYIRAALWLYCSGGSVGPSDPNLTACNSPSNAGSIFSDAMNWHYKPSCGAGSVPTMESQMSQWQGFTLSILSSVDLAKPFYSTEGGFGGSGWTNCGTGPAGQPQDYTDALMQASFIGRFNIYGVLKLNFANNTWYNDRMSIGTGSAQSDSAISTVYNWLQGGTPGALCSTLTPGSPGTQEFTYQCPYTDSAGHADVIVWDISQSCTSPNCTTTNQLLSRFTGGPYLHYDTLVDGLPHTISASTVPVGITPIRLRPN